VLCDRALLGAFVQGKERIDRATLAQAAREVFPRPLQRRSMLRPLLAILILVGAGAIALTVYQNGQPDTKMAAAPQAIAKPVVTAAPAKAAGPTKNTMPEAALPATLEWPADEPRARSEAMAYSALFHAWGAEYQGADACKQAAGLGLRCQTARGGLDDLRQFNRPAVLRMSDGQGQEFQATLTALTNKSATFAIGTETRTVALDALAAQWSGHYTLLWRMPPFAEKMRPGERGPAVEWLSKQLAQTQGRAAEAAADPLFDDALVRQVKQFQLAQGLTPDGAVGPQTLMRLGSVADQAAPNLLNEPGKK